MFAAALLGMEAAGMVINYLGNQNQIAMGRMGAELEQAAINSNIEITRAQAEDQTLQSMRKLRQNLGSQIAIQAARGNSSVGGTAVSLLNQSISNFNEDKSSRNLNMMGRINELKAQSTLSRLHEQGFENKLNTDFTKSIFNQIPFAYALNSFGSGIGAGKFSLASASQGAASSIGFGMTSYFG